ncbi:MAG: pseudouridine-5'-phosphate glycosidase, partial [Gemmataceae bacterium]
IGGVHPGAEGDVSADLPEFTRSPVLVVSAGAKSILDLPRTLEYLETASVPVVGYQSDEFPAFFTRCSGLKLATRCETPTEVARLFHAHQTHGGGGGVLVVQPCPVEAAIPAELFQTWHEQAAHEAIAAGVRGAALTPFLLKRLWELSAGQTMIANTALVQANARLAAEIAIATSLSVGATT